MTAVAERAGWCGYHVIRSDDVSQGVHRLARHGHNDAYGWPDWVFVRGGVVLFRELKTETGVVSRHQKHWGRTLPGWSVWRPSDEERILAELA